MSQGHNIGPGFDEHNGRQRFPGDGPFWPITPFGGNTREPTLASLVFQASSPGVTIMGSWVMLSPCKSRQPQPLHHRVAILKAVAQSACRRIHDYPIQRQAPCR